MIHFIVNPNARSGGGDKLWTKLEKQVRASELAYTVHRTEYTGHAARLAEEISKKAGNTPEAVVVFGGDGTLSEVADGLSLEAQPILGLIPVGSGNDFAKAMKIPGKASDAMDRVLHAEKLLPLDLGETVCGDGTHRRFAVSSGIGYDAAICDELNRSRLKKVLNRLHLGKLAYILLGLKQAATYKKASGVLTLDGGDAVELKNLAFLSVHNTAYEGGGWPFAPQADPSDGLLSVCVVAPRSRLTFAAALISSKFGGRHARFSGVMLFSCRAAELKIDKDLPVHTDGEVLGRYSELSFNCLPSAVRLLE